MHNVVSSAGGIYYHNPVFSGALNVVGTRGYPIPMVLRMFFLRELLANDV
jgi:hypothetical protein